MNRILRPRHWYWAVAAIVLVAAQAGLHQLLQGRAERREASVWRAQLRAMVRDREMAVQRWSQDLLSDAATVASYPTAVYMLDGGRTGPRPFEGDPDTHLRELLAGAANAHGYRSAWVFDGADRPLASSGARAAPRQASELTSITRTSGAPGLHMTELADGPAMLVITPVRGASGRVVGTVMLEEDPRSFLYPLLTYRPLQSRTIEVLLADRRGDEVRLLSPARKRGNATLIALHDTTLPIAWATRGRAAFMNGVRDYAGDRVIASTFPVRGTPWGLVAKIDVEEALAPVRRTALLESLALGGLLLALCGVAFGVYRQQRSRGLAAVSQERARYMALLRHANDPILIVNADGTMREVNERAQQLYGRPPEWFAGRDVAELRPPRLRSITPQQLQSVREQGSNVFETEHVRADGTVLPVEVSSRRVDLPGETTFLSIVRDLSERRAAELALRASEEKYRAIVENTPDIITRIGRDLRILYVSPGITRQFGYAPDQLIGWRIDEMVEQPELSARWRTAVEGVFGDGHPREFEFSIAGPLGLRYLAWRAFPEYDAEGSIVTVVTVSQDVTERRRLEEEFRQAQKMEAVGRLAGGVAHDFNNILTVIHGRATLARLNNGDRPELVSEIDEVVAAAERAASLTRQLLAFSRRQLVQPRRVDIGEAVRGMTPMLQRLIGEDIELVNEIPLEPLPVMADPGQLEQVLLNLCVNARDAMPGGGRITIGAHQQWIDTIPERAGRYVVLTVGDTGVGMTDATMTRIFEPFFTTKESGRGTGLGLSTVYGIVQQIGGHVDVQSEIGRGAEFIIYLPYHEGQAPAGVATAEADAAHAPGRTVLLAEDDVMVRRLAERMLRAAGYRVLPAQNGAEALAIAERERSIDLLLTDVIMPGMGGIELARQLRTRRPEITVVFMTGYTEDFSDQAGPIDTRIRLVQKPFRSGDLLRELEAALQARSS